VRAPSIKGAKARTSTRRKDGDYYSRGKRWSPGCLLGDCRMNTFEVLN
jgi:hypothetical protein